MGQVGFDAYLLLTFGGPEGPDDVMPFLRNVTAGRDVPAERLAEVAEHYHRFGGVSPINDQSRRLLAALRTEFAAHGRPEPWYWGNRNWHPLLADTVAQMRDDGVRRAAAFVPSPYGSYSSCRQYLEDIAAAGAKVGRGAPVIEKLRQFHDHPGLVAPFADQVRAARATLPPEITPAQTRLVFTAHSIPTRMAAAAGPSGGRYEAQLRETAALVAEAAGGDLRWNLVWQSRSGPARVPWLEPDINDHLATLPGQGVRAVVVSPVGFVSDHLEVVWDLDTEAAATASEQGLAFVRAGTPGTDPRFVAMVRELVEERFDPSGTPARQRLGTLPVWDECAGDCCRFDAAPA